MANSPTPMGLLKIGAIRDLIYVYLIYIYIHIYVHTYERVSHMFIFKYIYIYIYICTGHFDKADPPVPKGVLIYYRRDCAYIYIHTHTYIHIYIYTPMKESHICTDIYIYTYMLDILIRRTPLYRREFWFMTDATVFIYIYIPAYIFTVYTHPWKSLTYVQIYTYIHTYRTFW